MAANNRLFWAVKAVGTAPLGSTSYTPIHGLQSVGVTTNFNLEQVFEIGQISLYDNLEQIPDIQVTLEKVIDGYPLIYHLCTKGSTQPTLSGRSQVRTTVDMVIFGETQDSASGTPITEVTMSGLYVSSLNYTISVDGFCKESVGLVGNEKVWKTSGYTWTGSIFDNTDTPLALASGLGSVQRRQNVVFGATAATTDVNGMVNDFAATILPPDIPGISSSGTNNKNALGFTGAAIQNITVSADLGREALNELGHKVPYFRYVNFPVEVKTDIEIISKSGDMVSATEAGVAGGGNNLTARTIKVKLEDGTFLNMGYKNKLTNVSTTGGDAGGGNETITYSFTTYNDMVVYHPQDPSGLGTGS